MKQLKKEPQRIPMWILEELNALIGTVPTIRTSTND